MRIEVTMERAERLAMEFDATEDEIQKLKNGENPFQERMEEGIPFGDISYDYAVTDMDGKTIVDWSR